MILVEGLFDLAVLWQEGFRNTTCTVGTVVPAKLKIETKVVPLADVENTWNNDSGASRVAFVVRQNLEASASL